jgi:hypothetical protein
MMLLFMKIQKRKNPETLEGYGELCFLLSVAPNLSSLKPGPRVHSPPSWIIAIFFLSMEEEWSTHRRPRALYTDGQDKTHNIRDVWNIGNTGKESTPLYLLDQLIQTRGGREGEGV